MVSMADPAWTDYDINYGRKPRPETASGVTAVAQFVTVGILVAAVVAGAAFGFAMLWRASIKSVHLHMVEEAVAQYQIVEGGDDVAAKAIRAGVVAEVYLMAKDSENYHKWKRISEELDAQSMRQIESETKAMIRRFSR
jgi:hypothetical protein